MQLEEEIINKMSHYNKQYFDYQKRGGEIGGTINLSKFSNYINKNDAVLDFGCGGGYLLKNIDCKTKFGIEINPTARATCLTNGIKNVFESLNQIESDSIDVVISNHALEHVEDPINILREIYRVLKPGKKAIIYTPYDDYRNSKYYNSDDINFHLYTWNCQLMGNCMKKAGFSQIQSRVYTHAWPKKFTFLFNHIPRKVFDILCLMTAVKKKRRQILTIAQKHVQQ